MTFFCISNYNNNLDWVKKYPNAHVIYDKTWNGGFAGLDDSLQIAPSDLKNKYPEYNIINTSINGFNIRDYLTYIIDNYNNLPEVIAF